MFFRNLMSSTAPVQIDDPMTALTFREIVKAAKLEHQARHLAIKGEPPLQHPGLTVAESDALDLIERRNVARHAVLDTQTLALAQQLQLLAAGSECDPAILHHRTVDALTSAVSARISAIRETLATERTRTAELSAWRNENEVARLTYTPNDGTADGTPATVTFGPITAVNDAPVVIDPGNPGTPANPIPATSPLDIIPDVATSDGASLAPIDVASYVVDPDGEPLVFALDPATTPPWLSIDPSTGSLTGTAPADASQGTNTGTPGEYLVTITATDPDGASGTTTVTLVIANLAPVALDDAASLSEDGISVEGNVLTDPVTGDADAAPDSDPLVVASAAQGGTPLTLGQPFMTSGGGVLTLNANGSYTFEPGMAYNGLGQGESATESIVYTVSDGNGGTAIATLAITVVGANDAPTTADVALTTRQDQPVTGRVVASDVDGNPLTFAGPVAGPSHGLVVVNQDGTFTYVPQYGYYGADTFVVQVSDGDGGFAESIVTIEVQSQAVILPIPGLTNPVVTSLAPAASPERVGGIVLDIVDRMADLHATSFDISAHGMVLDVVNSIHDLESPSVAADGPGQSAGSIESIAELSRLADRAAAAFPMPRGFWDAQALNGYSVRMPVDETGIDASGAISGRIVVDTLMRDRIVFVRISNTLDETRGGNVETYKVLRSDGRPLPGWVSVADDGMLLIQAPIGAGTIDLRIVALLSDGRMVERSVSVDLSSGLVQELESDPSSAPLFDQQIRRRNAN